MPCPSSYRVISCILKWYLGWINIKNQLVVRVEF